MATASAASVKAIGLIAPDELTLEPQIAKVNSDICSGCLGCLKVCPFSAIEEEEITDRMTKEKKVVAKVVESVCHGCGACAATCRVGAIDVAGFRDEEILAEVEAI